jgi:hypothetical protein
MVIGLMMPMPALASTLVPLCHIPEGGGDEEWIIVAEAQVDEHLAHGDYEPDTPEDCANPARAGYYDTVWPGTHADRWRTHVAFGAGLPIEFDPEQLAVSTAPLDVPVWGYTRDSREVFVIGGSPATLALVTALVLRGDSMLGEDPPPPDLQDTSHVPYVAKIDPLTMSVVELPLTEGQSVLNYTGGLLMHANGYVYAVAQSVLYKIDPSGSMAIMDSKELPLVGCDDPHVVCGDPAVNFLTTYNGMQVLDTGQLVLKGYFLRDDSAPTDEQVPGWLILVDPDDLSFTFEPQSEALTSPRLTIEQTAQGLRVRPESS